MDTNDKTAIQTLFDKLAEVERRFPARDGEAERFISEQAARHPGALYYLAQTVITQEHALKLAEEKLRQAEADLAAARQSDNRGTGSFLSGLFGAGPREEPAPRSYGAVPSVPRGGAAPAAAPAATGWQQQPQQAPQQRSFLGGAAQTALGVAGGVMLGEVVGSMFGHHGGLGGFGGPEEVIVEREEILQDPTGAAANQAPQFDNTGFDSTGFDDAGGFDDSDDWT
ncbi:DUF2076 domain-containing protein [Pseudooceanicola sp. CBS1P-1]|uniref:DUF2076 family protein n=1 Tax=Pseudooceanicola albus TaxID=2692189 RepID=A0A6L7GA98_9RHOB|nr:MULTISPECIES: DUF2076 domain-containing protein [Pseudooceanicola]MBT9382836.1 DUF2076 domain-containing protein [Pseudooceanicola endophyticus]MXN20240.1 DUF2076 family protein [Pseudooceanicola albus]